MNYRKPRCEYKNCEKESDVQTETKSSGEITEYRWYCAEHYAMIQRAKESGLPLEAFELMENSDDKIVEYYRD